MRYPIKSHQYTLPTIYYGLCHNDIYHRDILTMFYSWIFSYVSSESLNTKFYFNLFTKFPSNLIKFLRIFLLVAIALAGFWGFCVGSVIIVILLLTNSTVNGKRNYLYPLIPFNGRALVSLVFRVKKKDVNWFFRGLSAPFIIVRVYIIKRKRFEREKIKKMRKKCGLHPKKLIKTLKMTVKRDIFV